MDPQNPQAAASMIDRIAAQAMGVPPQAAEAPAQQNPKAPIPNQVAAKTQPQETAQGKAAEQGSPKTEADQMTEDAVLYEVQFGEGDMRKLTPAQIKSTFERYSALNYKNAQYKPVMDLVEQIMRDNPGVNPMQMRQQMEAVYKAQQSNPTMGNTQGDKSGPNEVNGNRQPSDMETSLKEWEEQNAASLPPGYKDLMMGQANLPQALAQMQQQMVMMQRMMQSVLGQSQGVAEAAKTGMNQAQNTQINAVRQQIANNIDRVQQALALPDEAAQDFMIFAAERGFTMEDFVDPQLTIKVMQDFKNNMSSPEMERMRAIAQRRQAYTGSLGSAPSSGPAAPAQPQGGTTLDRLSSMAMNQRGMG